MKRLLVSLMLTLTSLVAVGTAAAPAQAAQAWVYVVVNNSVCGSSGTYVRGLQGNFNWGTSSSTINWDWGDNIIYPRVDTGRRTTYTINAACQRRYGGGWVTVGYRYLTGTFTPSYHQQTIWING